AQPSVGFYFRFCYSPHTPPSSFSHGRRAVLEMAFPLLGSLGLCTKSYLAPWLRRNPRLASYFTISRRISRFTQAMFEQTAIAQLVAYGNCVAFEAVTGGQHDSHQSSIRRTQSDIQACRSGIQNHPRWRCDLR